MAATLLKTAQKVLETALFSTAYYALLPKSITLIEGHYQINRLNQNHVVDPEKMFLWVTSDKKHAHPIR
jgi:hypothetical protein